MKGQHQKETKNTTFSPSNTTEERTGCCLLSSRLIHLLTQLARLPSSSLSPSACNLLPATSTSGKNTLIVRVLPQATLALAIEEEMGPLIAPIHAKAAQGGDDGRGVPAAFVGIDSVIKGEVCIPGSRAVAIADIVASGRHIHVVRRSEGSKRGECGEGWEAHLGLHRRNQLVRRVY